MMEWVGRQLCAVLRENLLSHSLGSEQVKREGVKAYVTNTQSMTWPSLFPDSLSACPAGRAQTVRVTEYK